MWTKHKEDGIGLSKPYYMSRKDASSLADYMVAREHTVSRGGRRVTRWALYDLNTYACRLLGYYFTLKEAKRDVPVEGI
jgi:hypothetical protein